MPATLRDQQALTRLGQVTYHILSGGIDHRGTDRHRQDQIVALGTRTFSTAALLTIGRIEAAGVTVVDERVEILVRLQIYGPAIAAIAPVGAAFLDELLTTEAHHAVTAVAGLYKNRYFIDEFHGNASRRKDGLENRNIRVLQNPAIVRAQQCFARALQRIQKQKSPVA